MGKVETTMAKRYEPIFNNGGGCSGVVNNMYFRHEAPIKPIIECTQCGSPNGLFELTSGVCEYCGSVI